MHAPPPAGALAPEEEHPSDADGPTIQALPPAVDDSPMRPPAASEPNTLMELAPGPQHDGPTMMAGPGARAAMVATGSDPAMVLDPDDDFEEDQDATMVANTRAEGGPLRAPPTFPQPSAAPPPGRGPEGFSSGQTRPPPPRFAGNAHAPPQVPPMMSPLGYPVQGQNGGPAPMHGGEGQFGDPMGLGPQHGYGPSQHDFIPQGPPGPPQEQYIPRQSPRMQATVPRAGGPSYDNRTMTAQRFKKRPPMWVVAALSCSIALLIAGVVIAIVSASSGPPSPSPTPRASSSSSPSTAGTGAGSTAAATPGSAGPFSAARGAFNTVVSQPGSSAAPTGTTPPGAVTAPPVATTPPAATAEVAPATTTATTATAGATTAPAATTATAAAAATTAAPTPAPAPAPTQAPAPAQTAATARPTATAAAAFTAVPTPAATPTTKKPAAPAALGAITVVCMPKCDQIIDNGASLGPGHIFNRPVPSGRHVLQLSAPNGVKKSLVIEVVPDQTKEVRMAMDK